jgi:hypothetical protein
MCADILSALFVLASCEIFRAQENDPDPRRGQATSALDAESEHVVQEALDKATSQRSGRTTVAMGLGRTVALYHRSSTSYHIR